MKKIISSVLLVCCFAGLRLQAQEASVTKESFAVLNLGYPGLEKVQPLVDAGKYDEAAAALLQYFQKKYQQKAPDFSNAEKPVDANAPLDKTTREAADKALQHQFQPHKGYGFFDYGKDINWQLWPVKDNEVRWQLHRVKWWTSLALAYHQSHNEAYAREWMVEFADWVIKNPLGLSKDNDQYAWRPLEVSDRIQSQVPVFSLFVHSPSFTPAFLMGFLQSYHQQAAYLPGHYATEGNHRLFEAQRTLFAGTSFPEFADAAAWRKSGIEVLNTEMGKQVYPDGIQYELSPTYHVAAIDIFLKAYRAAQASGLENEFPASYRQTIENMIMALESITFPDYNTPMFGDSWLANKADRKRQFAAWSKVFPENKTLSWFATEGKEGQTPPFLSKGLTTAGFYTFRNGWDTSATVMVLKASPPGEFHAQPDNGTFELYVKGRNFTPDAGVYVYSGDSAITQLRNWYRQTRVHSTLTLNNENMIITKARLMKWQTGKNLDALTYSNPSYPALDHRRSVLFIDHKYFLLIDEAAGAATGTAGIHFQLKEDSDPLYNMADNAVNTRYADGNNLLVQTFGPGKAVLKKEEGKVSYEYRKEIERPAFVFEKEKAAIPVRFVSVLYPYNGAKAPVISIVENNGNDFAGGKVNLTITVDGQKRQIVASLN